MSDPNGPESTHRPEPAHGPSGEHGGLEDLTQLPPGSPLRDAMSKPAVSRGPSEHLAGDLVAGGEMRFRVTVDGVAYDVSVEAVDDAAGAIADPGVAAPGESEPHGHGPIETAEPAESNAATTIVCPVAGVVVKLLVAPGDAVEADQPVAIVEALKVESRVLAPRPGVVAEVLVQPGQRVCAGDALVRL